MVRLATQTLHHIELAIFKFQMMEYKSTSRPFFALHREGTALQEDVKNFNILLDVYDTMPPRPRAVQERENWDALDPMAPFGKPIGKRFSGADYAGYIVGYEHRKAQYIVRYDDGDHRSFHASELDDYLKYYDIMQNRTQPPAREQNRDPPPAHAQEQRDVLFADFDPVPGTYADTVVKAGGFAFLAQLSQDKSLLGLRDHRLPTSVPARNTHRSLVNATKLVLSLCPLFSLGSEERETLRQFAHFLPQLIHAEGLRHQDVESLCAMLAQGKWKQLWGQALAWADQLKAKKEQNPPTTARQRCTKEKSQYAHRCATADNVSKACKIVCKEQIPACNDGHG
jgi:hypothetical protein